MDKEISVLLVEDNPSDAEMTVRVLKKNNLGNQLLHVTDGAEALDFLFAEGAFSGRQIESTPRVILLDLKMPKVSGIEVLQKIKTDERTKRIPVVMLTSSREEMDIQQCYDLGANGYVIKPMESDKFHKSISNLAFYWMILNESSQ